MFDSSDDFDPSGRCSSDAGESEAAVADLFTVSDKALMGLGSSAERVRRSAEADLPTAVRKRQLVLGQAPCTDLPQAGAAVHRSGVGPMKRLLPWSDGHAMSGSELEVSHLICGTLFRWEWGAVNVGDLS